MSARPKSEPVGIGIPTGAPVKLGDRQMHCPGALLRISRADYAALKAGGEVFSTDPKEIRHDGYSDARIWCTMDVATIRVPQYKREDESVVVSTYPAALCNSCAALERANRATLAERGGSR